jgi:sterol desaturase/sphingolipid hydroxylase (fatty acid hydroxylase superfamily)
MAFSNFYAAIFGLSSCIALIRYILLPFYDVYIMPIFSQPPPAAVVPILALLQKHFHYDPYTEHIMLKMMLGAIIGYWSIAIITTVLDCFPSLFLKYKIQGARSLFTVSEWLEAATVSMINLLFFSWWFALPLWYIWKEYSTAALNRPVASESDDFVLLVELGKLFLMYLIVDVWFYWTHRLIHTPLLYKLIHKLHHRFKAPTAVASMYANPIEFCIGNLGGVVIGPVITNCHPYTAYFWTCFGLFSTGGSHSGYTFFDAKGHDAHHEFFNYNFGVGGLMDYLCGTAFEGSDLEKKMMENSKKKSS